MSVAPRAATSVRIMMTASGPKKSDKIAKVSEARLRDHALGAYLGLAIGDALGATVEFMTRREIQARYGVHQDIIGGGWLHLEPGQVTDDTQMALALGDAILTAGGVEPVAIADAFLAWMSTKPKDIGHTVRRGLVEYRRTGKVQQEKNPDAAGNGACMRIAPLAIFTLGTPRHEVREALYIQNHITHHADLSDAGTETVTEMIQASILDQVDHNCLIQLAERLGHDYPDFVFPGKTIDNPSAFIVDTLKAVFQSLANTDCFEDCLINVTNRGGDADTTGAIAGMIAGAFYGLESIPDRWLKRLDKTIAARITEQTEALLALGPLAYGGKV